MVRGLALSIVLAAVALFLLAGIVGLPGFREVLLALGIIAAGLLLYILLGLIMLLLLVALALPLYYIFKAKKRPEEERGSYTLDQVKP